MEDTHDDLLSVYEIGYLVASSVAEENVPAEAEAVKKIITDAGASIISEEMPHYQPLAYTIRIKTVSGSYQKFDDAYFGWVKFEVGSDKIEAVKKSVEVLPSILRMLLTSTVRENTYLGKRAPAVPAMAGVTEEVKAVAAAPVSVEEMDKSIEALVKEA